VEIRPDDLARIINAVGLCACAAGIGQGIIEGGVGAAAVKKAVVAEAGILVSPDDLGRVVDAESLGDVGRRGVVESGVSTAAVEEAVSAIADVLPDDLACAVAPKSLGISAGRVVYGGVGIGWHDTGSSVIVSLAENVDREAGPVSNC